jgi:hypothetical protein
MKSKKESKWRELPSTFEVLPRTSTARATWNNIVPMKRKCMNADRHLEGCERWIKSHVGTRQYCKSCIHRYKSKNNDSFIINENFIEP